MNLILFISCTKESSKEVPLVDFISPEALEVFKLGDTIELKAQISDKRIINRIELKIRDENTIPIYEKYFQINASEYLLEHEVVVKDPTWKGAYYFDVRAFNDQDYGYAFRYFTIESENQPSTGKVLFRKNGPSTTIYYLTGQDLRKLGNFQGDLLKSVTNQSGSEVFFCGEYDAYINAIDTNGSINWRFNGNAILTVPYFSDMTFASNTLLASTLDGRIIGFDQGGNKVVDNTLAQEFKPGKIFRHEQLIIYEKIRKSSGQVFLRNEYYPSGLFKGEVAFPYGRISQFQRTNWNKIILTSNKDAEHYILEFNTETQFIEVLFKKTDFGDFTEGVAIGNGEFLIIKGQDLVKFDLSNRLLTKFKSGVNATGLRFDEISGLIWYLSDNQIIALSVIDASVKDSTSLDFTIDGFELVK